MASQPFIPFASVAQATVRFTMDQQKIENVFHFSYAGAAFSDCGAEISAMLQNEWWNLLRPWLSNQLHFNEIYIVDLSSQDGAVYSAPITLNNLGQDETDHLPNSTALCVTLRTAKRGRSFQGRSFVSGIPEDMAGGSYVYQSFANSIAAAYENLRSVAGTSDLPLVIASRRHNKQWRTVGEATPVIACVVRDLILDVQRRRTPGRGQ